MAANATGIANTPIRLTSAELGVEDDLTQGSEQRRSQQKERRARHGDDLRIGRRVERLRFRPGITCRCNQYDALAVQRRDLELHLGIGCAGEAHIDDVGTGRPGMFETVNYLVDTIRKGGK